MSLVTDFTRRLGLSHPIIQAPMAGSGDNPELVAAVSSAGGIGFFGGAYSSPDQIAAAAAAVRAKTLKPFGVNLFAPVTSGDPGQNSEAMMARLAPYFTELGLPRPSLPAAAAHSFDAQFSAALESGASCFSFTFGLFPPDAVRAVKERKMFLMGTATTVEEALLLEKSGVDAIVAQGSEAGGHRGTFTGDFGSCMVGTMSLVPQIVDAVHVPVIASGGIMDGRGIAAALALGASAVQMGTAFLVCEEAGICEAYRQAILTAREDQTRVTRAFSGRPARGIVNRFMSEVEATAGADSILPFPQQNALTRPLRTAAAKQGRAEFLSLWAGQGVRMARRRRAADLVALLALEMETTAEALGRMAAKSGAVGQGD